MKSCGKWDHALDSRLSPGLCLDSKMARVHVPEVRCEFIAGGIQRDTSTGDPRCPGNAPSQVISGRGYAKPT